MMRTVSKTNAKLLDVVGEHIPGTKRTAIFEQPGGKGPFKMELNSDECCNFVRGAETEIEFKQKVQDGQHVAA